jgi:signal transduction histidine kinase
MTIEQVGGAVFPAGLLVLIVATASVVLRYRRSSGEERQQIKWFAFAVAATMVTIAATAFSYSAGVGAAFNLAVVLGVGVAIPAACGVAILKYRLYGIDVVVSRTLVYGALAALITVVYIGIAVGMGTLVGSSGKPNLALSILATAVVAVGFQPVRGRLQRLANRLVYGKRATPYEVLSEFSGRVAETYAADDVLPRMAQVLMEGSGAQSATVWLRSGEQLRPAATYPAATNGAAPLSIVDGVLPAIPRADRAVTVEHQGELLGALSVVKRRGEALTPMEARLIDDLAHQAGLVLKNVGLTGELRRRLEDLRISRQRLVQAQDAERRRLERNLHDGAQQHLVALKVKLGLAQALMDKDPARAASTLVQLNSDADEALDTLRELARGIYPPLLADQGLVAALEAQARRATVPATVDAQGIDRYSQDVEATVYFCVLEALQNVQKYSHASHAIIHLREVDDQLRFEVTDNGGGFDVATARRGSGLTNIAERLDTLGGSLEVESAPGAGTTLRARLPFSALMPA